MITALSLILVFCLKKSKKRSVRINSENINILPPLVLNSTSGNHTHTIIFLPGFSNVPEDFVVVFTNRLNYTKKNDTNVVILRSPLTYTSFVNSTNYSWFEMYQFPLHNDSDYNLNE